MDPSKEQAPPRPARPSIAASIGDPGPARAALGMAEVLAAFDKGEPAPGPAWLQSRRQAALARAARLDFPTTQNEEWRFTRVTPILKLPLHPVAAPARRLTRQEIAPFTFGLECWRLVFVDGRFCAELSSLPAPGAGVEAGSLRAALAGGAPGLEPHLTHCAGDEANVFTALNTAFFQDGALVRAAAGGAVAQPVHLLFIATAAEAGATAHVRNLIVAGPGSEMKILETYATLADGQSFTNAVTELVVGDEARMDHCKIQEEGRRAFHIAHIAARQGRGGRWTSHSISTGAHLSRHQIQTLFQGEGGHCLLNGLYLAHGDQRVDHHTIVDHAKPRCESHEFYHGVLSGRAQGVFNGKIFVRQDAQKTNAKQTNRNLLLSDEAVIDTKPQLEIFADDVKCTHGATVGQIDEEAIFYLRSRGIGLERARQIMVRAFASDVVGRIPLEPVRAHLNLMLTERFKDKE
ncbi:MAG: Fe-S cluster assembly protein SufD [Verrucomicrobiota bacterium]